MRVAEINALIREYSPYPVLHPAKGKNPLVALIGVRDLEKRTQHVAAVSVSGMQLKGIPDDKARELLRERVKVAAQAVTRAL